MTLDKINAQLLNDIFSAYIKSPDGLNALKYRADNEQFLTELDQLQKLGYLNRKDNLYSIGPLALAQLSKDNLDASDLVNKSGLIFALLRGAYKDNPEQRITVPQIASNVGLSVDDVRLVLTIITQTSIIGGYSTSFTGETSYVKPSENILKYETFEDILSELQEWTKKRNKRSNESAQLATQSQIYPTEQPTGTPIQLFDSLELHTKVIYTSRKLFEDGHYRDAIYRAFVEVETFVKAKANSQLSGKNLMSEVFRQPNPKIKLNPLVSQTDKDEQEGFMFLYMGATVGIRNPKAHENIIQTDPYKALRYLSLASLLIERIDFWEAE